MTDLRASSVTISDAQQDTFLRIKAAKVSQLLDLAGELSLVAASVTHHPEIQDLELESFDIAVHNLEMLIRELQDLTSSLRLVPIDGVFRRMQRLVRDLSHQTGKQIALTIEGAETEIDKVLVDQLHDPLMHIVRNAVDHGLEPADERKATGKPEKGQLTLLAAQQGREIWITVADDGRGLSREKILAKARAKGIVGPADEPDDQTVWGLIFHSGLSTAETVSSLSGRGVGMDVVRSTIQSLRGRISIDSKPGLGSQITLHIPLTLAFLDSMVVRFRNQLYTLPIDVVNEVIKPERKQITRAAAEATEMIRVRDDLVPICRLGQFYNGGGEPDQLHDQVVVVVRTSGGSLGLPVDEVLGQQQVTMKPLEGQLKDIRAGAGCVLLGSGDVAIALDCEQLYQQLMKHGHRQ